MSEETKIAKEPVESPPAPQEPPKPHKCPRCGHEGDEITPLRQDDREEFLRALLAGEPFRKKYPLYDGRLIVECEAPGTDQSLRMATFEDSLAVSTLTNGQKGEIHMKARALNLVRAVIISGKSREFAPPPDFDKVEDMYLERFKDCDFPVTAALTRCAFLFQVLLNKLKDEAFDKNFWEAAGPI